MTGLSDSAHTSLVSEVGLHLPTAIWRGLFDAAAPLVLPYWRGYPPGVWLEAIALHESSGNPLAVHQDKPDWLDTSYGLFQLEGRTAQGLLPGLVDPTPLYRPILNMALALSRLDQAMKAERRAYPTSSSDEQIDAALAAYNGGEGWGALRKNDGTLEDQGYVDFIVAAANLVTADRMES